MNTPWKIVFQGEDYGLVDAKGNVIACNESHYPSAPSLDAAKLIVRAVNSHQALVEALELISEHDEFTGATPDNLPLWQACNILNQLRLKAREALKLAKGE